MQGPNGRPGGAPPCADVATLQRTPSRYGRSRTSHDTLSLGRAAAPLWHRSTCAPATQMSHHPVWRYLAATQTSHRNGTLHTPFVRQSVWARAAELYLLLSWSANASSLVPTLRGRLRRRDGGSGLGLRSSLRQGPELAVARS